MTQTDVARVRGAFLNSWLRLIVMPTEKCNFRCVYCYENFKHGKMPDFVSERLGHFISDRVSLLSNLEISWFGGEPLLAQDVIKKIMTISIRECDEHGVVLSSGVTTNGYLLTKETFQNLLNLRINHYQISLDGPSLFHNQRRRIRNGLGRFDVIRNNLFKMCETNEIFTIGLRIHLDLNNMSQIEDLFDELNPIVEDSRVSFCFERLKNLGKPILDFIRLMSQADLDEFLLRFRATSKYSGCRINDALREQEPVCYAALPNNFVVRSDGRIQKCTVALEDSRNTVGQLSDGGLTLLNQQYETWLRGWKTGDVSLLRCPAAQVCFQHA